MHKSRRIVLVKWIDSCGRGGWRTEETVKNYEPSSITSVGFQIKRTRQKITLAISCEGSEDGGDIGDVVTIPMGCVKEIETIRKQKA